MSISYLCVWWCGVMWHEKTTGLTRADFAAKGFSLVFSPYQQGRKRYSATDLLPLFNNEQFSDVCFVLDDESKLYAPRGDTELLAR